MEWSIIYDIVTKGGGIILDENERSRFEKQILLLIRYNRRIVVFGNSGSGKSQLANSMKKSLDIPNRNTTTLKRRINVEDFPIKLIDTPGHPESHTFRKDEVENIIKNGVEGIINVVSFGYDEIPDANREVAFDKGNIRLEFLQRNRNMEIERLNEWINWVRPTNTKWIITLVNKADLWWDNYKEVSDYYKESEYAKRLSAISNFIPVLNLPHCSIIRPFFGVKTSAIFGDEEKEHLQALFISNLLNLLNK